VAEIAPAASPPRNDAYLTEKNAGHEARRSFVGRADITFQRGTYCPQSLATWEDAAIIHRQHMTNMSGCSRRRNAKRRMTAM
jgi:hypothetical protein